MQTTDNTSKGKTTHRKVRSSTTLSRKYVRRPGVSTDMVVSVKKSPKINKFSAESQQPSRKLAISAPEEEMEMLQGAAEMQNIIEIQGANNAMDMQGQMEAMDPVDIVEPMEIDNPMEVEKIQEIGGTMMQPEPEPIQTFQPHPMQTRANQEMRTRAKMQAESKISNTASARELKDRAIKQALMSATDVSAEETMQQKSGFKKVGSGFGRVMLAFGCTAIAVFMITYFVNMNMPDISLKVAAMQSGINASYPSYVPRDYAISTITSENKKIALDFKNTKEDGGFLLTEETSSWDSNALLNNYVKETYKDNFTTAKEQGLTIYISGTGDATWTSGGVVYKITSKGEPLTHKQITSIATSL